MDKNKNKYWTNKYVYDLSCKQKELVFNPEDVYSHVNTNYSIIMEIVERVSGKPLWKFADENIFKPLNMKYTFTNIILIQFSSTVRKVMRQ